MVYVQSVGILRGLLGGRAKAIVRARRPEALARSLDRPPLEGLDWLGHRPSARAPFLYRLLLGLGRFVLLRLCAVRIEVEGRDNLPHGGYIVAAALHRGWVDPLAVILALPVEPRVWFLGSGATAFSRRWMEWLLRRIGGILPVWRGGADVAVHVDASRAVVEEGGVLCLFIEGAIVGPPDRVWPGVRSGAGLLALRTDAPIVPIALIGGDELYRGRRIALRILPPTSVTALLNSGDLPAADTRDELRAARTVVRAIAAQIDAVLPELAARVADPPSKPRRWRWLTRLFR
jgi:1-acyl-sn-glycerol-3-phosphate acyltransferase